MKTPGGIPSAHGLPKTSGKPKSQDLRKLHQAEVEIKKKLENLASQKFLALAFSPPSTKKVFFFNKPGLLYRDFNKPMKLKDDEDFLIPSLTKSNFRCVSAE